MKKQENRKSWPRLGASWWSQHAKKQAMRAGRNKEETLKVMRLPIPHGREFDSSLRKPKQPVTVDNVDPFLENRHILMTLGMETQIKGRRVLVEAKRSQGDCFCCRQKRSIGTSGVGGCLIDKVPAIVVLTLLFEGGLQFKGYGTCCEMSN